MIRVQTVCKDYQQIMKVASSKERVKLLLSSNRMVIECKKATFIVVVFRVWLVSKVFISVQGLYMR